MTLEYTGASAIKARLGMGTASGTADTLIATIASEVNAWLENRLGRAVGPGGTATRVYDGNGKRSLYIRDGVQSAGTVTVYEGTRGAATTLGTADYYLDPAEPERAPGEPAFWITFSDNPTGAHAAFPLGKRTVSITGVWGWAAIPVELAAIATRCAISDWRSRASAGGETFTVGANGERTYERYLSFEDRKTLDRYAVATPGVG